MANETARQTDHGQMLMEWKFSELPNYSRSRRWYFGMSLFGLAAIAWSVFDRNPMFAIIVLLFLAIVFFQARQRSNIMTIRITEDGFEIGKNFYAHDDISKFWIIYKPPAKTLYLRFKSAFRPVLGIPLEDTDPVKLRQSLTKYLTEDLDQEDEPASDAYGRLFKI